MRQREGARRMKLANKDWLDVPVLALKTILDINIHKREHKKAAAKAQVL